jgi:hypothetical protein
LHKNSSGNVGFGQKDGHIRSIIKDSSAARNGLLINHRILEVNGQNVVALKVFALFYLIYFSVNFRTKRSQNCCNRADRRSL